MFAIENGAFKVFGYPHLVVEESSTKLAAKRRN
jgi:hypothetical protein